VSRGGQKVAFVVHESNVTETAVEIAGTLGNLLEVRSGLAEAIKWCSIRRKIWRPG
jgi:hypothetical protein